jgi:hypothetical protein
MDDGTEIVWREALKARGRDWVMAQLQERPGRAEDPVLDVVFETPFPTRAFCRQWCAEEDNKLFSVSKTGIVAFVVFVLFVICVLRTIGSWNADQHEKLASQMSGGGAPAPTRPTGTSGGNSNGDISTTSLPTPPRPSTTTGSSRSSSSSSSNSSNVPSVCGYASYQTAECGVQH